MQSRLLQLNTSIHLRLGWRFMRIGRLFYLFRCCSTFIIYQYLRGIWKECCTIQLWISEGKKFDHGDVRS